VCFAKINVLSFEVCSANSVKSTAIHQIYKHSSKQSRISSFKSMDGKRQSCVYKWSVA